MPKPNHTPAVEPPLRHMVWAWALSGQVTAHLHLEGGVPDDKALDRLSNYVDLTIEALRQRTEEN